MKIVKSLIFMLLATMLFVPIMIFAYFFGGLDAYREARRFHRLSPASRPVHSNSEVRS
jgi:hypothetical protein